MDLKQYVTDSGKRSGVPVWWNFEFPNDRGASVRLSTTMFRFDVEFDLNGDLEDAVGLTSGQVEAILDEIANSPATTAPATYRIF